MASRHESGGRLTWRALPGDGQDRHPGLALGRSCPTPARAVIPGAAIERRVGGRRTGVEVFGEGLRPSSCSTRVCDPSAWFTTVRVPSSVMSWRLRIVGRERRDLLRISMGSRIPTMPASIRMTPTACRSRLPMCPLFSANVKIAPRTMRVMPAGVRMTRRHFRGLDRELGGERDGVTRAAGRMGAAWPYGVCCAVAAGGQAGRGSRMS